jgi:6-phosphogluconolactonase
MTQHLLIGTYTETLPHVTGLAHGVLGTTVDGGALGAVETLAATRNPSWLTVSDDGRAVYAVAEAVDFEGTDQGGVVAFARDPESGALTLLGSQLSGGAEPAHLAIDPTGRFVVVANYGSGTVAVLPILEDRSLGEATDVVQHFGSGPDAARQESPHAHQVVFDPTGQQVIVVDLGVDSLYFYDLDETGHLGERVDERFTTEPGAGPRHVALHPDGRHLFVLNELDSMLLVLRRDASGFAQVHAASTLPADFEGASLAAEVRVSPSGRFVYTTNRGDLDSIAVFGFDADAGAIALLLVEPSIAAIPRDFVLTADGAYLIVAGQDSDSIVTFAVDEEGPTLTEESRAEAQTPVCVVLA